MIPLYNELINDGLGSANYRNLWNLGGAQHELESGNSSLLNINATYLFRVCRHKTQVPFKFNCPPLLENNKISFQQNLSGTSYRANFSFFCPSDFCHSLLIHKSRFCAGSVNSHGTKKGSEIFIFLPSSFQIGKSYFQDKSSQCIHLTPSSGGGICAHAVSIFRKSCKTRSYRYSTQKPGLTSVIPISREGQDHLGHKQKHIHHPQTIFFRKIKGGKFFSTTKEINFTKLWDCGANLGKLNLPRHDIETIFISATKKKKYKTKVYLRFIRPIN